MVEVADTLLASAPSQQAPSAPTNLVDLEREHITKVLEETSWTIEGKGGAAALLGLVPSTLRSRMAKLGITQPKR